MDEGAEAGRARLRVIKPEDMSSDTAQTPGMLRSEAISGTSCRSGALWMGETRMAPATRSANHHHGHSETGIFVASGHPVFVVSDGSGGETRFATSPGDYVFVPPFVPHREENPSADSDAVVIIARTTQEAIAVNVAGLDPDPQA
jgi:uncharacterized RmlC-like cupin family protein